MTRKIRRQETKVCIVPVKQPNIIFNFICGVARELDKTRVSLNDVLTRAQDMKTKYGINFDLNILQKELRNYNSIPKNNWSK